MHDAHNLESYNSLNLCVDWLQRIEKPVATLKPNYFYLAYKTITNTTTSTWKIRQHDLAIHHKIINLKRLKN